MSNEAQMTGAPPPGQRDLLVDAMRGLAAIAVALFHFNELPTSAEPTAMVEFWRAIWKYGHLGVPVFFVISGYCIGQTWSRSSKAKNFLRRRLLRIFPPYWASLALLLSLALTVRILTGVNDIAPIPRGIPNVVATVTLLTDPVTVFKTMNWVYWSLSYEIAFYFVMTLVLAVWPTRRVDALVPVNLAICVMAALVPITTPSLWFFVRLWPLFGLGLAVSLWLNHRTAALWTIAGCAAQAAGFVLRDESVNYLVVAWLAAALLWLGPKIHGAWVGPLAWTGECSYSLYLIHVPVGCLIVARFVPMPADNGWLFFAGQSALLISCLFAAYLFFRCFEKPFMGQVTTLKSAPPASHEI